MLGNSQAHLHTRRAAERTPTLGVMVVRRSTGAPVAGVPVVAEIETRAGTRIALGLLATDHVGYASFRLGHPPKDEVAHVWVAAYGRGDARVDALPAIALPGSHPLVTLEIDDAAAPAHGTPSLPSYQDPCAEDWLQSPASLASRRPVSVGDEGCEVLLPGNLAVHEFRFRQVVRDVETPIRLTVVTEDPCTPTDVEFDPPLCVRHGMLHEYQLAWCPLGHSLGELVYSLPLAPCESVNLAVIDWSRRDDVARREATSVDEDLLHAQRRDRTVEETVRATLDEWQRGGSAQGGIGLTVPLGPVGLSFGGGGGYTTSSGSRDVAANGVQTLADAVAQASSAVRRIHSTVVVQARQNERDVVETRTVTNHNHCHALTVLYYEVLRHWRVVARRASTDDLVLVRYPLVTFDRRTVLCHAHVLRPALLDPGLAACFDAVERLACRAPTSTAVATQGVLTEIELHVTTGAEATNLRVYVNVVTASGERVPTVFVDPVNHHDFSGGGPTRWLNPADAKYVAGEEAVDLLAPGHVDVLRVRLERPLVESDARKIELGLLKRSRSRLSGPPTGWSVDALRAIGTIGGSQRVVYDGPVRQRAAPPTPLEGAADGRGAIGVELRRTPPEAASEAPGADECCEQRLLAHLGCHAAYYNRVLWLAEDPGERAMRFDRYPAPEGSGRLLDAIENRIVAVVGDWVGFPARGPDGRGAKAADLADDPVVTRIVSLPTRGVFAEAQLGHCTACEKRDVTRFWDWQESPCPEKAPPITEVSPRSRAQATAVAPTVPAAGLGVAAPPAAPDPGAMLKSVLEMLSTPDVFRDMSGAEQVAALLGKLVEGAVALRKAELEAGRDDAEAPRGGGVLPAPPTGGAPAPPRRPASQAEQVNDGIAVIRGARVEIGQAEVERRVGEQLDRLGDDPDAAPEGYTFASFDLEIRSVSRPAVATSEEERVLVHGRLRGVGGETTRGPTMTSPWYSFVFEGAGVGRGADLGAVHRLGPVGFSTSERLPLPDGFVGRRCVVRAAFAGIGTAVGFLRVQFPDLDATAQFLVTDATAAVAFDASGTITSVRREGT